MTKLVNLTTNEQIILNRLRTSNFNHPVKMDELSALVKTTERNVKMYIENLRIQHGVPVVSLRRYGYYLPINEEERVAGIRPYQKQIVTEMKHLSALMHIDLKQAHEAIEDYFATKNMQGVTQ